MHRRNFWRVQSSRKELVWRKVEGQRLRMFIERGAVA